MEFYLDELNPKYKFKLDEIIKSLKNLEKYVSIVSTDDEMIHINFSESSPLIFCEYTDNSFEYGHLSSVSFICDKKDTVIMTTNSFSFFNGQPKTFNWNDGDFGDSVIISDDDDFDKQYTKNFYLNLNWKRFLRNTDKILYNKSKEILIALFENEFN